MEFQKYDADYRTQLPRIIVFHIIRDLQLPTTFILKNQNLKLKENRFQELLQNCGMIPTKLRTLPKLIFIKKIRTILFNILESEDSYEDLESIISKVRKYS